VSTAATETHETHEVHTGERPHPQDIFYVKIALALAAMTGLEVSTYFANFDGFMLPVLPATGSDAVSTFLVDANGSNPQVIADRLRTALGTTATVTDITSSRTIVGSSLTAVDLAGLTRVELAYALALAVAASGLTLWLGLAERRRIFAIAAALGARARQVGAFVWIEATIIAVAAVVLGGLGGWALTNLLVKVLTGVFDPAPAALTVPVGYLAIVAAVLVGAVAVAARAGIVASQRDPLATLRSR
jgi:putative ABC transport system permease protein